jgi:hypothetical protein
MLSPPVERMAIQPCARTLAEINRRRESVMVKDFFINFIFDLQSVKVTVLNDLGFIPANVVG